MAQDRRVVRTKSALTQALFELLEEKEFERITVTELTRRANVDRKTFYLHYQTPGDILEEFYEVHLAQLQSALEREQAAGGGVDIATSFRSINGVLEEELELYRHLAKGPASDFFKGRLEAILKPRLRADMSRERWLDPREAELYVELFTTGVLSVYLCWLRGKLDLTGNELAELMTRAVLRGVAGLGAGERWSPHLATGEPIRSEP